MSIDRTYVYMITYDDSQYGRQFEPNRFEAPKDYEIPGAKRVGHVNDDLPKQMYTVNNKDVFGPVQADNST